MGSMLRFEDEVKSNKNEVKLFVASDKHLTIVWEEKTVDAFLNFVEELRDYQYKNDVIIKSLYGHIDRNIRDYVGTILRNMLTME